MDLGTTHALITAQFGATPPMAICCRAGSRSSKRGQPLKRVPLLRKVLVPIVDPLPPRNHVGQHSLRNIGPHASPCHERLSSPANTPRVLQDGATPSTNDAYQHSLPQLGYRRGRQLAE